MHRRRLLALCGSLVTTPGCVSMGDDTVDANDTVTPAPLPATETDSEPTETTASTGTVEVRSATVQPGVVGPDSPDSIGVFDEAGQYLVVDIAVDGPVPAKEDFELRFDQVRYQPESYVTGLFREGEWSVRFGGGGGLLVFPLPATSDVADTVLTWPGGTWRPTAETQDRLTEPLPAMSVSLDGPTRVRRSDDPQFTITVTNEGDRTGRYVLALNRSGPRIAYIPVARMVGDLGPGETWSKQFDAKSPYITDPPREAVYHLDAPGDDRDATLRISPTETATDTSTGTQTE